MGRPAVDISQLPAAERFELIEQFSNSLRARPNAFAMSPDEQATIETRREAHRRDASAAVGWDSVRADLAADQDADDQLRTSRSRPHG
jgi:putative addiction module component (TIGR02574 family)